MIMRQVLRWKYSLTTWGHKTIQQNFPWNILNFLKNNYNKKYQAKLFCFILVFSLGRFGIEKIISKLWTSISRSNVGNKYNLGIPGVAQTHMMTHTKREPRGRPRDPSLCRKTILETTKSLLISYYYKFVFLHIEINKSWLLT